MKKLAIFAEILFLVLFISGCVSSRFISYPTPPPAEQNLKVQKKHFGLTLHYLIIPNSQGSWVKDAPWVEYVLTLKNSSNKSVSVTDYFLVDVRGVYVPSGADPNELETESQRLVKTYKDLGISGAILITPSVLTIGALSTGSLATAGAAMALGPVAIVVAPTYYFTKRHLRKKDQENIQFELNRRNLSYVTLAPKGEMRGSIFFPLAAGPKALVVDFCPAGGKQQSLELNLEKTEK